MNEPTSDADHVAMVRAAVQKLNVGDVDGYLQAFTPDSLRRVPGVDVPFPLSEIAENISQLAAAFSEWELKEDLLFGEGRHVCARWRMVGTHTGEYLGITATGREVSVENCEIYQFDRDCGGLVTETWSYGDPLALFRQLGAVPGEEPGAT